MRRFALLLVALALFATACSSDADDSVASTTSVGSGDGSGDGSTGGSIDLGDVSLISALQTFDSCQAFLDHVIANAVDAVGPWGLGGGFFGPIGIDVMEAEEMAMDDSASADLAVPATTTASAESSSGRQEGVDFSGTNVQEVGIDEPDLVKTDGERMLVLAQGQLHLIDVTGSAPVLVTSVAIPEGVWVSDMLFDGDRVLLLAGSDTYAVQPLADVRTSSIPYGSPVSTLIEVTVADSALTLGRQLHMDGSNLSARMIDGVVRLVVQSGPVGFQWEYPQYGGEGLMAQREERRVEDAATEANRELVRNSTIQNWLPYYVLEAADGSTISEGTLVDCEQAYHPEEFSGLNMLNVVTIDLRGDGLGAPDASAVMADGQTVYASQTSLYVATNKWIDWAEFERAASDGDEMELPDVSTTIHKFDISDPTRSVYVASGSVPGTVLNQFSLSELDGRLRIATTREIGWWGRGDNESSSSLFVLETVVGENGPTLEIVGQVDDLGRGERIFAVRYLGELATVVTFRQTDPLYTIDLSDPTNPTVLGELKINGYSAYLHPISEDLILGVGQDATDEGRTIGSQVSLFDISDLANPTRVAQWTLPNAWSASEWDARAFLYWPGTDLVVIPVNLWGFNEETGRDESFFGAIGLRISDSSIVELGRISMAEQITSRECWGEFGWYWEQISEDGTVLRSEGYDQNGNLLEDGELPAEIEAALAAETLGRSVAPASAEAAEAESADADATEPAPEELPAPDEPVEVSPGVQCVSWVESDWMSQISRTVVVGDQLHAIAERGVLTVDLDTFVEESKITFTADLG